MIPLLVFIVLGISQGILEWLPVSSEGQIVFIGNLFDIEPSLLLSIAFWLHFGTMISVLVLFREKWKLIINLDAKEYDPIRRFLIISTIGTGIVGVPVKLFLLEIFNEESVALTIMIILIVALVMTGFLLKFQKSTSDRVPKKLSEISDFESFLIGCAQGLSIIPGVSRSGSTVTALILTKIESEESFEGSFLMSVPAVLGAITLDLFDYLRGASDSIIFYQPFGILLAIGIAAIIGYFTMQYLIKIARTVDFSNIVFVLAGIVILYVILVS